MTAINRSIYQDMLRAIADEPPRAKGAGAKRSAYQLTATDEQILDALMEHGPCLALELADWTGRESRALGPRLGVLVRHGLVTGHTRSGHTRTEWTITDEGRRAAITPNPEVWQAKGA